MKSVHSPQPQSIKSRNRWSVVQALTLSTTIKTKAPAKLHVASVKGAVKLKEAQSLLSIHGDILGAEATTCLFWLQFN